MMPIRFGTPMRQIYGVLHPAHPQRRTSNSVLMCNPLGQEAVRMHRFYRVLADQLSIQGINVLRFDYHGTGESGGEDEDGELEGWLHDLALADQEMRQRTDGQHITWMGARLGGSLAAMASSTAERPPDRLVLWEPILDGPGYLKDLAWADAHALQSLMTPSPVVHRSEPANEVIGFAISETLIQQLRSIGGQVLASARARDVRVVHHPKALADPALIRSADQCAASVELIELRHAFDWLTEEALNTALVPGEALKLLLSQVEGAVP
jgi:alpha-beta hydrolase superfamily lysophospholipase